MRSTPSKPSARSGDSRTSSSVFGLGRLSLWNLGFSWDETPHVYSTTVRMLESEVARDVFTLPTPRPALTAYNFGRRLDEVGVGGDTGKSR